MRITDALAIMHQPWLSRVSHSLARGEELRESITQILNRLYEKVQQAVETGDPSWIDPALLEWADSRTESELDSMTSSLPPILDQILQITVEVAQETLEAQDALLLTVNLLPIFMHAYGIAAHKEMELNIQHISRELEKANASLERLDSSKSDFIAIAAHELKTPLTLIEGYAAMLRESLPSEAGKTPQHVILLKGIDNGTRRLREIVDDMIDVSLIDNDMLSLHFQPIWMNRLFQGILYELNSSLSDRILAIEVTPFQGIEEMTFGDEERLHQAFHNLLSNAIKFTPDHGKIVIDGRLLPGFIEITIRDTGIGIDPEDQTAIFEKFGRLGSVSLHSSGKTKFKGGGPGLGLPITKGIIEAHGGAIWVESAGYDEEKCPGSTFHIMLPIRKLPPDDKSAKLFLPLTEGN